MIVGPLIPPGVAPVATAVIVACSTTRWIGPLALRALAAAIQGAVIAIAAALVFPEYHVSKAHRRRHLDPPQIAYDYGAVVGRIGWLIQRFVGFILLAAAGLIRALPMAVVAVAAGAVTIVWLLI